MRRIVSSLVAVIGLAIVAVPPAQTRAANLLPLVSFNGANGLSPRGELIADAKGNLFGTTFLGSSNDHGTVFEIVKNSGGYASTPTTLVNFCSLANCADGEDPVAGLIADAKGNLFGTTQFGGAYGRGTVFEIAKTASGYASTPTILVSFCALANCADGAAPSGGLVFDSDGNLFGTTRDGGVNASAFSGTVFEIAKTPRGYASTPIILVNFCSLANCADGAAPQATLIADPKGNLFGTTTEGGANGAGTVFEIIKTHHRYASIPTTLVSFCSLPNCADGRVPFGSLIADAKGNLFGTTAGGPFLIEMGGAGTVFEIVKTAGGFASTATTLVNFCSLGSSLANCADGKHPMGGLIADAKGNLFSTTSGGGADDGGTVFEVAKTAGGYASTPTTLVNFCSLANCADGEDPLAGLIADAKGNLFGTTNVGGANNSGTVFEVTDSGFVIFAGRPGKPNCFGQSVSALARQYGGLNNAAEALGYSSVRELQKAILEFCEPDEAANTRSGSGSGNISIADHS